MMETIGTIALLVLFVVLCAAAVFVVPLGLPGTWALVLAGALYAWWGPAPGFAWGCFLPLLALALLAEVVEFLVGLASSRRYGATWWGVAGAVVGGFVVGTMAAPILGLLGALAGAAVGAFAGGFIGEYARERNRRASVRAGLGGFVGRLLSALAKTAIAGAMAAFLLWRVFTELGNSPG